MVDCIVCRKGFPYEDDRNGRNCSFAFVVIESFDVAAGGEIGRRLLSSAPDEVNSVDWTLSINLCPLALGEVSRTFSGLLAIDGGEVRALESLLALSATVLVSVEG